MYDIYIGHAIFWSLMVFTQTTEANLHQKDVQLDQQMRTIQNLNTQLGEKDETLRRREEEFRVEVQRKQSQIHQQETQLLRKETQLRQKNEEIHRKDADISRLQRELQVCM